MSTLKENDRISDHCAVAAHNGLLERAIDIAIAPPELRLTI
jgi:hypothetical protein